MGNPNMARNTIFHLVCQDCGRTFECKVSRAFRCPECREKHNRNRFATHREGSVILPDKPCQRCGKMFTPRATNVKKCDDCKAYEKELKALRKPILKCPCCGNLFNKTGNNQKRCPLCQFKQLYGGDYRTMAFENFPHVCNRCGKAVDLFTADVHHKDRNRQHNELSNLEILCKSCHHKEHMVVDSETGKIITNR